MIIKLIPLALTAALVACGGGGGSSGGSGNNNSGSNTTHIGVLTDSAIAGVQYASSPSDKTGITNSLGEFEYNAGDKVVFTVAGLALPEVTADGRITPITLAAAIDTAESVQQTALNLAILFQALDSDGDPSNGISIGATTLSTAITVDTLKTTPASFVADLKNESSLPENGNIPTPAEAFQHFYQYELAGNWKQHSISNTSGVITAYPGHNRFLFIDEENRFIRAEYLEEIPPSEGSSEIT